MAKVMTKTDYHVISLLSDVVATLSPADKDAIAELVKESRKDGSTPEQIIRQCVNLLATGVNYGNWPSVIAKL